VLFIRLQTKSILRKAAESVPDEELSEALRTQAKFFSGMCSKYNHPFNPVSNGAQGRVQFNSAFDEFNGDRVKLWEGISSDEHWSGECSYRLYFQRSLRMTIFDRF
jgi:hypothetical protein